MTTTPDQLSTEHYTEIVIDSAVSADVVTARGYRTLEGTGADRDELAALGFVPSQYDRDEAYPLLLIPMKDAAGEVRAHQIKPHVPRVRMKQDSTGAMKESPIKYETPKGAPLMVDVPDHTRGALTDSEIPLWVTEGVKKVDSLVSQGIAALGLTGVWNWRSKMGTLGDWEDIPLKGRPIVICFDADAKDNRHVQLAMSRFGAWLKSKGASAVHYLVIPDNVSGVPVKGVDDYFAAGGDLTGLKDAATLQPPGAGAKDASFSDAFLVEEAAAGALEGKYCWVTGLGWMKWNGKHWTDVSDVEPLEVIRQWAQDQFNGIMAEQSKDPSRDMGSQISGWRAVLGGARLRTLTSLARGIVLRDADLFDTDPDLLTVQNGTVHLPTGRLLDFDPEHCITKIAGATYVPGASHPLWDQALTALPASVHPFLQDRVGQALTGYKTPDHKMVLSYGGGNNGKSTITNIVRRMFGDYGVAISDRVILGNPGDHPTELMDFRGARYAVLEETPEARHLNVQRLKQQLGTETIKARRIRQDPVEFLVTHGLFVNSNYKPVVNETDHGTWRRLALLTYPYTFRAPGKPLSGPLDRQGDPRMEYAHEDPAVRSAALAWFVQGAMAWYARGRMMLALPDQVESDTREWRTETDLIMGFADECLEFTPDGVVMSADMLKAFNDWSGERGHRPWNDKTFAARFGAHDEIKSARVGHGRVYVNGKRGRGWTGVALTEGDNGPWGGPEKVRGPEPEGPVQNGNGTDGTGSLVNRKIPYRDSEVTEAPVPSVPLKDSAGQAATQRGPLGWDIETASSDALFRGEFDGPYVRLAGLIGDSQPSGVTDTGAQSLVDSLGAAECHYGHNIFGFDLLALARHAGADYDALADKAIDTLVLARLVDPPVARDRGGDGGFDLDTLSERLGGPGKTNDIKALAQKHGGFDKIPQDDPEYHAYLKGDLLATQHVFSTLVPKISGTQPFTDYAHREMKVVALQNRMTLNGWGVNTELLAERVTREAEQRAEAVEVLHREYGMPVEKITYKLRKMGDWPDTAPRMGIVQARAALAANPGNLVALGMAEERREPYAKPWSTDVGKAAIIEAFRSAGAEHHPRTATGDIRLGKEPLGTEMWFDTNDGKSKPGMAMHYADNPAVLRIIDLILRANGASDKYAEIQSFVTPQGRVHPRVGAPQATGRWATTEPATANMAKRGTKGLEIREIFDESEQGLVHIACDLSQVDLRAMAGLSQDPAYIEILQPGRDAHMEMADVYFGARTKETRAKTKAFNHAGNYGQGPKAVSERTGIPLEKCYDIQRAKAEAFPRLAEYIQKTRELAASGQLMDNGFGRMMRPDPERHYTQGPALMGQGAARDIMCESLLRLDARARWMRDYLRAVVHDEVIVAVPEERVAEVQELLRDAFTWEWRGVPILCDVSEPGRTWADCYRGE